MSGEFKPDEAPVPEAVSVSESSQYNVVYGSVTNLPQEQKNVIRIFLSSTFTGKYLG